MLLPHSKQNLFILAIIIHWGNEIMTDKNVLQSKTNTNQKHHKPERNLTVR